MATTSRQISTKYGLPFKEVRKEARIISLAIDYNFEQLFDQQFMIF